MEISVNYLDVIKRAHRIGWARKIQQVSGYPEDIESALGPHCGSNILAYILSVCRDLGFADNYSTVF